MSLNNCRYWKGKKLTAEHRAKVGMAGIGRIQTIEDRRKKSKTHMMR